MTDSQSIDTGGGAAVQGDAKTEGGDFVARDQNTDQRHQPQNQNQRVDQTLNQRAGDMYVGTGERNDMSVWVEIMRLSSRIQELTQQMDNLPNRVDQLERTEVIVKPGPEVMIRQVAVAPPPVDAIVLTAKTLLIILFVSLILIAILVGWLIYLGVT